MIKYFIFFSSLTQNKDKIILKIPEGEVFSGRTSVSWTIYEISLREVYKISLINNQRLFYVNISKKARTRACE